MTERNRWGSMVPALALLLLLPTADRGQAARVDVEAGASAIAEGVPGSRTGHLVRFDLPECLARAEVDLAVAESTADVQSDVESSLTLTAYMMTEDWESGVLDWSGLAGGEEEPYDRGHHAMWTAVVGDASMVRLDVTEMVTAWIDETASNRGLVIVPSLGEAAAVHPAFVGDGRGGEARLTVWYTSSTDASEPQRGTR